MTLAEKLHEPAIHKDDLLFDEFVEEITNEAMYRARHGHFDYYVSYNRNLDGKMAKRLADHFESCGFVVLKNTKGPFWIKLQW